MKRNRINRDRRLLEALDYLDEAYIADVVDNLKVPPVPGAPLPKKGRILRSLKPVAMLVACTLLLAALIPAVTYMTSHIPDIVAFFRGEHSEATVPEETDPTEATAPPETTAPIKHEHNGSEGLIYRVNDDGKTVTLISWGNCNLKDITVASVYDGMPVIAIADGAFTAAQCRTLTLPNSIISIGVGAFKNCRELSSVNLPVGLKDIGSNAFEGCTALRTIELPSTLTLIPSGLFTNCENLARVTIKNTMKRILIGAFIGCNNLDSIHYEGNRLEWNQIQKGDFWHMKSAIQRIYATSGPINVPPSPGEVPIHNGSEGLEYSLSGTEAALTSLGTCTEKDVVIASLYMGYPVKYIYSGVFEDYTKLESVSIPEAIVSISSRAFANCKNLKSVSLPPNLSILYSDAFAGCSSIESIEIDQDNPTFKVIDNCLIETAKSTLVMTCKNSRIPTDGSITIIGEYALNGITADKIVIPEGVHTIRPNGLSVYDGLKQLSLPSSLKNLDIASFPANTTGITILFPNGHPIYTAEGNCIIDKNTKTLLRGFAHSNIPDWVTTIGESAFEGCTALTEIRFPSSLKTIGESAFRDCTSLKKIKIDGAVTLKTFAFFGCTSLKEVELDDKVQFDYAHIFSYCTSLEYLRIPKGITHLEGQWEGCTSLKTIVMHDDITFLGGAMFYGCTSLESVYIGPKVRELRQNFLVECPNLKELVYGGTRHEWYTIEKHELWRDRSQLEVVRCTDGDISNFNTQPMVGSYGLLYRANSDGKSATFIGFKEEVFDSFEIASTYNGLPVTGVAKGLLNKISSSGTIILGTNIETIAEELFLQSPYVTHIELRPNVKSIEKDAFRGCIALKELTFRGTKAAWDNIKKHQRWNYGTPIEVVHCLDGDVSVTPHPNSNNGSEGLTYRINTSNYYAVFTGLGTCTDTDIVIASEYYGYPVLELTNSIGADNNTVKSVKLPDSITIIPYGFFSRCMALEKVIMPDSVKAIDRYAFSDCISLKEIKLPKSLDLIEDNAFSGCVLIEKIELPDSLLRIGNYAFLNCTSLQKIAIPDGVTFIGFRSFEGTLIDSIYIPKSVTEMGVDLGYNIKNITIDPENPVYVITGNCLIDRDRKMLLRVFGEPTFPNDGSIRYIEELAFRDIDFEIKKLILPEGLEEILWYNGKGLESVEELHIPSTFVSWGAYTFNQCPNLKKITVAEDNPRYYSVGNCVIERDTGELVLGCSGSVIPNDGSIRSIGRYAFYNRAGLEKIVIPEGVTEIIFNAFANCTSLREVKLPESLRTIDEGAFRGCSTLEAIKLGKNVNMINMYAFAYCTSLREVTIPEGIYANCLGWDLFRNCTALEWVYVPRGISYIGFSGCSSLREIVYGGTVEEWWEITIYDDDFHGTALERITCTDGVITEIPYETEMPLY